MYNFFKCLFLTPKLYVSLAYQNSIHIFTKIAFKPLHTNLFYIALLTCLLSIGTSKVFSQEIPTKKNTFPSNTKENSKVIKVSDLEKKAEKQTISLIKYQELILTIGKVVLEI